MNSLRFAILLAYGVCIFGSIMIFLIGQDAFRVAHDIGFSFICFAVSVTFLLVGLFMFPQAIKNWNSGNSN